MDYAASGPPESEHLGSPLRSSVPVEVKAVSTSLLRFPQSSEGPQGMLSVFTMTVTEAGRPRQRWEPVPGWRPATLYILPARGGAP